MIYLKYGLPLALFIVLVGMLHRSLEVQPHYEPPSAKSQKLVDFNLPSLMNPKQTVSRQNLENKTVLIHFWASWCHTCQTETAWLLKLRKQGVPIVGITYKDEFEIAKQMLGQANPYQWTLWDPSSRTALQMGVISVPETLVKDAAGYIRYRHRGPLTQTIWTEHFAKFFDLDKTS